MKLLVTGYKSIFFVVCVMAVTSAYGERNYYPSNTGHTNKIVRHACRDRIRENIWSDHRYIQKVEFTRGSLDFQKEGKHRTRVDGSGKILNRKGHWKHFTFSCSYNHRRDEVVNARYTKAADNTSQSGYSHDARRACKHEIDRKVLNHHDSASRIRWDQGSVTERRESHNQVRFNGSGSFVNHRGKHRTYKFQCVYDRKLDDVHHAWIDINR